MSENPQQEFADTGNRQFDCPNCKTSLPGDANFCVGCGADVSAIGVDESLNRCSNCDTDVAATDNYCINCGTAIPDLSVRTTEDGEPNEEVFATLDSQPAEREEVPESLILEVDGYELDVGDGDTVGGEIRAALSQAGRTDNEVLRIHREHVRFIRKSDGFHILDMGDNQTHLNGRELEKGDSQPVGPGDELELSGVAAVTIQSP